MTSVNGHLTEVLAAGRKLHNDLLLDTVVVTRVSGGTLNRTTHQYTGATSSPIYSGQGRVKRSGPTDRTLADRAVEAIRPTLDLPWGATGADSLATGDTVTVTSADPALNGRVMTVVAPEWGTTSTTHRYLLEDVDR